MWRQPKMIYLAFLYRLMYQGFLIIYWFLKTHGKIKKHTKPKQEHSLINSMTTLQSSGEPTMKLKTQVQVIVLGKRYIIFNLIDKTINSTGVDCFFMQSL